MFGSLPWLTEIASSSTSSTGSPTTECLWSYPPPSEIHIDGAFCSRNSGQSISPIHTVYTLTHIHNIAQYTYLCYKLSMKVHFACSTSEIATHKEDYRKVGALVKEMGHTIRRDCLKDAIRLVDSQAVDSLDREDAYNKVVASILTSDVVIIEGTVSSFSVGHQVTLGLTKSKPTLFLVRRKEGGTKNAKVKDSFLAGITSPLLTVSEYDDSNLADVLNDFLNNNGGRPVVKFNIVLTKEIENYLDWASFTYKINKSQFIRNLVLRHMKNEDIQYKKYIVRS